MKERYLHGLRPTKGAKPLLSCLRARGYRLVVATSANADDLHGLLSQAGIEGLFDETASATDARASKPDPDIVQAAVLRAAVPPNECIMLGDTPYDIRAAKAAGVETIAFRCGGGWQDDELADAVEIYDDPQALLNAIDRSRIAQP